MKIIKEKGNTYKAMSIIGKYKNGVRKTLDFSYYKNRNGFKLEAWPSCNGQFMNYALIVGKGRIQYSIYKEKI